MLLERAGSLAIIGEQLASSPAPASWYSLVARRESATPCWFEAFCREDAEGSQVLLGRCDDLFAPRPLGPLIDIAQICARSPSNHPAEACLQAGESYYRLLDELSTTPPRPVIAVIEDAQWAD